MSEKYELVCEMSGIRVDAFIAENTDISRSAAATLCDNGAVQVNGASVQKNVKLKQGDMVEITLPEPTYTDVLPQNIPIEIVYEDDDLLVVNKKKGMVVHPAVGNADGTLVNALLYHCGDSLSGINGVIRPGIVHRIDKDTSGLLMVAKNDTAHNFLAEQIKEHSFSREYEAVVYGNFREDSGIVNAPIGRHPVDRKKMTVTEKNSRYAITRWRVIRRYGEFTHLRLILETGRTHQIRVHMAHIGHAVAGDAVYGPKKTIERLCGQCLHARYIKFQHPNGKEIEIESELPDYFTEFLDFLDKKYGDRE